MHPAADDGSLAAVTDVTEVATPGACCTDVITIGMLDTAAAIDGGTEDDIVTDRKLTKTVELPAAAAAAGATPSS